MIRNLCIQLLFLFAAFPVASFAQANAVDAAVNGYVLDPSKNAVSGARNTLTNVSTGRVGGKIKLIYRLPRRRRSGLIG